jgi:TPR repeat protein
VLRVRDGTVDAEAETLLKLGRLPNLVRFYGLCHDGADVLLVTELAPMGSLSDLLERLDGEEGAVMPPQHKIAVMQQVANGMAALAAEKMIHRDLAIRNVLVCAFDVGDVSKTVCKVSDFGLTVNGYTAAYAYADGGPKPTRYLAPESLEKGRYSEKSDVWAFGVLVWELVTDGKIPYYEMPDDTTVIAHVCGGGRLARPTTVWCPDAMWDAMVSCWATLPRDRPTFQQLCVSLGQLGAHNPVAATDAAMSENALTAVAAAAASPPTAAFSAAAVVAPQPRASATLEDEDPEVHRLRISADQGHARAQCRLGVCYANGRGVPKDAVEAVRWYRLAADQGHARAQVALGVCYSLGSGVSKDEVEAVRWYRLAADQGHANAQYNLGVCYELGTGAPKDEREAVRWYRLAADQGHARAQCMLGVRYATGKGVPKDEVEAVRWYRLAADQGYAIAQCNLGVCYELGTGAPKDEREVVRLYSLAADQGYAIAQFNLGVHYANGKGVPKDEVEAVRWYRLAADQGNADAQFKLGRRYAKGSGVEKNMIEAVRWYRLAADQGHSNARAALVKLDAL